MRLVRNHKHHHRATGCLLDGTFSDGKPSCATRQQLQLQTTIVTIIILSLVCLTPLSIMSADQDPFARKRPAPVLTTQNWEKWFDLLRLHFRKEGYDYVTVKSFQSFAGDNKELQTAYNRADANALYLIKICVDDFDEDLIRSCETAFEAWAALWQKYSAKTPQARRDDLANVVTFKMPQSMKIDEAWIKIRDLRRIAIQNDPSLKDILDLLKLFGYFLSGLPSEYSVTRDTLDT